MVDKVYLLQLHLNDGNEVAFRAFESGIDAQGMIKAIDDFEKLKPSTEDKKAMDAWERQHPCSVAFAKDIKSAYVMTVRYVGRGEI